MYGSSLFDNLKMLEKEDWKDFKLFVDSDFNNKGSYKEETRWLLQYISSVYPDFKHPKVKSGESRQCAGSSQTIGPRKIRKNDA